MGKKYTVYEEEEEMSDAGFVIFLTFVVTIVGFIFAVFAAFMLVGVVWGTLKSIYHYIRSVSYASGKLGLSISTAWEANVANMQYFFGLATAYDGILKVLVQTFLVMAGIGVIFMGTILMPVWMLIHIIIILLTLPFRSKKEEEIAEA